MSSHREIMKSASLCAEQCTIEAAERHIACVLDALTAQGVSLHNQKDLLIDLVCTKMSHPNRMDHAQSLVPSPPATSVAFDILRDDSNARQAPSTSDSFRQAAATLTVGVHNESIFRPAYYSEDEQQKKTRMINHSPISNTAEPSWLPERSSVNDPPEYEEDEDDHMFPDADSHIWGDDRTPRSAGTHGRGWVKLKLPARTMNNEDIQQERTNATLSRDEDQGQQTCILTNNLDNPSAQALASIIHTETSSNVLIPPHRPAASALPGDASNEDTSAPHAIVQTPTMGQKRHIPLEDRDYSYSDGDATDDEDRTWPRGKRPKTRVAQQDTHSSSRKKIERAYALGSQYVLSNVSLKQILDISLAGLDSDTAAKADIADLCTRLFYTEKAFRAIYQGGRYRQQAENPTLSDQGWAKLSCLVDDPSHLLKDKTDDDYGSILAQMSVCQVYVHHQNKPISLDPAMRRFLERERQPISDHESHQGSSCDVASLLIGIAYGGKMTGAAKREAELRLKKLNEQAKKLHLLENHLGSGSLIMLSSTSWRAALYRIQENVLAEALEALTERFPGLRTIFDKLQVAGLEPPSRPAITLKDMRDFAEFMNGEHCDSPTSARRRLALKAKAISTRGNGFVRTSVRGNQETGHIVVQQHNRPNQAPVASMASTAR